MKKAYLIRTYHSDHTAGVLILTHNGKILMTCNTMELPDRANQRRISCIPEGVYQVQKYSSPKYKVAFEILNVPNRSAILIHAANSVADLLGCIGVGSFWKFGFISDSRNTVAKMRSLVDSFELHILSDTQERSILSAVPAIVSLLGTLTPQIIELITAKKDVKKVIKAVLATDASADDKIQLIEQILEL